MKIFDYADLGRKCSWDYTELGITPEDEGIIPITETEKQVDVGDILIINKAAYAVCSLSGKGRTYHTGYVQRLKNQAVYIENKEPKSQNYTSEITCPF